MKSINIKAPVKCNKTISINATPKKVWDILTDIDHWPDWHSELSKTQLNGAFKSGTGFVWKNGSTTIHSSLHSVEPMNHFGWTGKAFGSFAIHNWTLTETNNQTLVTVDESMEGLLVKLFKKQFSRILDNGLQTWLDMLKKESERK